MSIATDEAERRYPIEYSNFDCDVSKLSACRRAFALGAEWQSQREPTEAEIEAAAKEIAEINLEGTLEFGGTSSTGAHMYDWHFYINNAKSVLMAARKAVKE